MSSEPIFMVRDVPVYGDTILAPMAGFSDVPTRAICRAFGSAMQYTEFVPAEMLLGKRNATWALLDFKPEERPKVAQVFGNEPQSILRAAQRLESWGVEIIDVNMGCSTRRVSGRGAGVGMMRQPGLIAETFNLLSRHLSLPVTGKIRLGWEERRNYLEVGQILQDNGAALVAIHPRTREQKYGGEADWEAVARLKQALSIPVIGNGDVTTPEEIDRLLAYTGCDAVMIGRGAIGNPWLFGRQRREDLPFSQIAGTIRRHLQEMVAYYGPVHGVRCFRKHLKAYLGGMEPLASLLRRMVLARTPGELEGLLALAEAEMGRAAPAPAAGRQLIPALPAG